MLNIWIISNPRLNFPLTRITCVSFKSNFSTQMILLKMSMRCGREYNKNINNLTNNIIQNEYLLLNDRVIDNTKNVYLEDINIELRTFDCSREYWTFHIGWTE